MEQREVALIPDHSRWWLVSPGVLYFYDRIIMDENALSWICDGSDSSYHNQLRNNIECLRRNSDLIRLIKVPGVSSPTKDKKALQEHYNFTMELLSESASKESTITTNVQLKRIILNAYQTWIGHCRRKIAILSKGEPHEKYLSKEELPLSLTHLDEIKAVPASKILPFLEKRKEILRVIVFLIANSRNMVALVDHGYHVYDPLMPGYLPIIKILERKHLHDFTEKLPTPFPVPLIYSLYKMRMARYRDVKFPLDIAEFLERREAYSLLRYRLDRIDIILKEIKGVSNYADFISLSNELCTLIEGIKKFRSVFPYSMWGISILTSLISLFAGYVSIAGKVMAFPFLTKRLQKFIEDFWIYSKGIGPSTHYFVDILESTYLWQKVGGYNPPSAVDIESYRKESRAWQVRPLEKF